MEEKIPIGLTFEDVLIIPSYSEVHPRDVDVSTYLTKKIKLNIPIISAAMDTVSESKLCIALAQQGGIGTIHRNLSIEAQCKEVEKVKRYEAGMITEPITVSPNQKVYQAIELMKQNNISGLPVVDENGKLVGILTSRDLRFETNLNKLVKEVMTKEPLFTVPIGTTLEEAKKVLHKAKVEKLLVVDKKKNLKGLITVKDIQKKLEFPNSCKDEKGRLRVCAAVGTTPQELERAQELIKAKVDCVVVDSSHAHSKGVMDFIKNFRKKYPSFPLIAGNVGTKEGAEALIKLGVDAIKVGIGPGSICTTRIISGAGVPQLTAIMWARDAAKKEGIPIIADGGIKFSGDITKAIAAGAHSVMIGSLFAGTEESPGEIILYKGRTFKSYRGMGSLGAMEKGGRDRYFQEEETISKLVPEGVEGRIPYKGPLANVVYQLVGGLKSGMGLAGCKNIEELRTKAKFIRITLAGLKESHVHDVAITKEAPNYQVEWIEKDS